MKFFLCFAVFIGALSVHAGCLQDYQSKRYYRRLIDEDKNPAKKMFRLSLEQDSYVLFSDLVRILNDGMSVDGQGLCEDYPDLKSQGELITYVVEQVNDRYVRNQMEAVRLRNYLVMRGNMSSAWFGSFTESYYKKDSLKIADREDGIWISGTLVSADPDAWFRADLLGSDRLKISEIDHKCDLFLRLVPSGHVLAVFCMENWAQANEFVPST